MKVDPSQWTTDVIQDKNKHDHALRSARINALEKERKKKQRRGPTECTTYTPKQRHVTDLSDV